MAKVRAQWSWSATAVKAVVVEGCGRGICQHQFRVCLLHIVILGLFPLYLFFSFFFPIRPLQITDFYIHPLQTQILKSLYENEIVIYERHEKNVVL